jgi:hypothetical protein
MENKDIVLCCLFVLRANSEAADWQQKQRCELELLSLETAGAVGDLRRFCKSSGCCILVLAEGECTLNADFTDCKTMWHV